MLLSRLIRPSVFRWKPLLVSSSVRPLSDLVTAAEISSAKDSARFVDLRSDDEFDEGHIPGAVNVALMQYFVGQSTSEIVEQLQTDLAKMIGDAGIKRDDTVILYEQGNSKYFPIFSCSGHFLFKYMGCQNVSVLQDGFEGWQNANLPICNKETKVAPVDFEMMETEGMMLTKEDIISALEDKQTIILDCRDEDEWYGKSSSPIGPDYCPRKGRIPGSKWIKWTDLMETVNGIRKFKSPEEIRKICQEKAAIQQNSKVAVYCFIGARSSNTMLALKSAGIQNVGNYFASWNEWSRYEELPIENE